MGLEGGRRQLLIEERVGIVFAALQLGDDDRPLRLAVLRVVEAAGHALGLDEQHAVERVARGRLRVGGLVDPGVAVPVAAELLDDALHLVARDVGRALEVHVLDPVRDAGEPGRFVLRADAVPAPDRRERRGVNLLHRAPAGRCRATSCRGRDDSQGGNQSLYNRRIPMPEWKDTVHLPRTEVPDEGRPPQETGSRNHPGLVGPGSTPTARFGRRGAARRPGSASTTAIPYANASIHLGQALNKILKDFVVKSPLDDGPRRAVRAGLGLPRAPDRASRGQGPRSEARRHGGPLEIPRAVAASTPRSTSPFKKSRSFAASASLVDRRLDGEEEAAGAPSRRAILPHDRESNLRGRDRAAARTDSSPRVQRLLRREAGALVLLVQDRARRSGSRVRRSDRSRDLREVPGERSTRGARARRSRGRTVNVVIWTTTPWTLPGQSRGRAPSRSGVRRGWRSKARRSSSPRACFRRFVRRCHGRRPNRSSADDRARGWVGEGAD